MDVSLFCCPPFHSPSRFSRMRLIDDWGRGGTRGFSLVSAVQDLTSRFGVCLMVKRANGYVVGESRHKDRLMTYTDRGFKKHRRPTKRVGYFAQRGRLPFSRKKKQLV